MQNTTFGCTPLGAAYGDQSPCLRRGYGGGSDLQLRPEAAGGPKEQFYPKACVILIGGNLQNSL